MKFTAHYKHNGKWSGKPVEEEYYRTIHSDTLNTAMSIAKRYERKNYICVNLEQKDI